MVQVDLSKNGVNVLVSERHMNVVGFEKLGQKLTKFFAVKRVVRVTVELGEVLVDLGVQLGAVRIKFFQVLDGGRKFVALKVCRVDHYIYFAFTKSYYFYLLVYKALLLLNAIKSKILS